MTWETLIDPTLSARLCLTLGHSLWQVATMAALAWWFDRIWPLRVERRYALHASALIICLAAMPLTFCLVQVAPSRTEPPIVAVSNSDSVLPSPTPASAPVPDTAPVTHGGDTMVEAPTTGDIFPRAEPTSRPKATGWLLLAPWLAGVYAIGVAVMLVRLSTGVLYAYRIRLNSDAIREGPLVTIVCSLAQRWSMKFAPTLASADQLLVPKVVGLIRPAILIPPAAIAGLSVIELELILAHELTHLRRYDMWVNLLQRLAETVGFFNPAIWYLSRRVSTLREYCCDELTCRALAKPNFDIRASYAAALLHVVELVPDSRSVPRPRAAPAEVASLAATNGSPSELRRRIAVLFGEPVREGAQSSPVGAIGLATLVLALVVGPVVWQVRSNSEAVADEPSTAAAMVLRFPQERAVGVIHSRPAKEGGLGHGGDWYSDWQLIGPATGNIDRPAGHEIRLDVSKSASTDLSFLQAVDPEAIDNLQLEGTDINDQQLKHVGRLTGLRLLNLEQAKITDEGVQHLGGLRKLRRLDLSAFDSHREGFGVGDEAMAVIARLPVLESISLRLTKVTDLGVGELAKCKSLRSIGLEGTKVTDLGIKLLVNLPRLEALSFGVYDEGANVTDEGLKTLGELRQLKSLRLSGIPITDDGLAHLSHLHNLEGLNIDNTKVTNAGLRHLAGMRSLRRLRAYGLADGDITDEGAKHLARVGSLERIVAHMRLTDDGVRDISKLSRLQSLSLNGDGVRVTDEAIHSLSRLTELKRLTLNECAITDKAIAHLKALPMLEDVHILRTGLSARALRHLAQMPALRFVRLGFEDESRRGAQSVIDLRPLAELKQIRWLSLSCEGLPGEQLVSIAGLSQLEHLDLDGVVLDDVASRHLSELKMLSELRIESSQITDEGISFLSGMGKLEYLTISCLATDEGLRSVRGLNSLRMLQIASPYVTDSGLDELSRDMPSLQRLHHGDYRLDGESLTASSNDVFLREGASRNRPARASLENKPAPATFVGDWMGPGKNTPSLSDLQGKVVLVDFCGIWSRRWNARLPVLKELYKKYHGKGFEIRGIHSTSRSGGLEDFLKQEQIPWPVAIDVDQQTAELWRAESCPDFYLIDRAGRLRFAAVFGGHLEAAVAALVHEDSEADSSAARDHTSVGDRENIAKATLAMVIERLQRTERHIASLQVDYKCLTNYSFRSPSGEPLPEGLIQDDPVASRRQSTVVWEATARGLGRHEAQSLIVSTRADGSEVKRRENYLSTFDGDEGRTLVTRIASDGTTARTAQVTDKHYRTTMSPYDFTTYHLGMPISEVLALRGGTVTRETLNRRPVLVVETPSFTRDDGYTSKRRYAIDPGLNFAVVRRQILQPQDQGTKWTVHHQVDSGRHEQVQDKIWLPMKVLQTNHVVPDEGPRRLVSEQEITVTSWRLNEEIDTARFRLKFPENVN